MSRARVAVQKVAGQPDRAVGAVFDAFGGAREKLKRCRAVFIKVNTVYFHPHLFTSIPILEAVVRYIKGLDARKKIYVMDNCSQGNFTRLNYAATGMDKAAGRMGAKCLYLDEEKTVTVSTEQDAGGPFEFPKILHRHLVMERDDSFYLNMPVLKAHCQAQMTAGLKNQMGLLSDLDRARDHNHGLHRKIVDIYRFIQPDFTLTDALKVLAGGPMPAGKYVEELLHPRDLVLGGTDTVAVDAVATKVLGHEPSDVKHVELASEAGLGVADLSRIDILGELPPASEKIPWEFQTHLPEGIRFVVGKGGACYEGCLGHAEQVLELVVNDSGASEKIKKRPLTILAGKQFEETQLDDLTEPVVVLGKCACAEVLPGLRNRYKQVDVLDTCGRCDNILAVSLKRLGVSPFALSPVSLPKMIYHFLVGKLNGLKYTIPR